MTDPTDTAEARFRHYDADELTTTLAVSGWVPKQNVAPLLDDVPDAEVQYWSDDGWEAFVTTL